MRLFYYIHKIGNFGDDLSPVIVNGVASHHIRGVNSNDISKRPRLENFLFALGSIFHFVRDNDVIWGTGVNIIRQNPKQLNTLDIRAVRGPLSREFIVKNYDLDCPEVYGDPALLSPILFPLKRHNPVRKFAILPHGGDIDFFRDYDNVILPNENWDKVIDYILGAELVISSGLHGLIIAEAFGIPARWIFNESLPSSKNEGVFKYNDYFLSTDRSPNDYVSTVEEALRVGGKSPIVKNFNSLLDSFPSDRLGPLSDMRSSIARLADRTIMKALRH